MALWNLIFSDGRDGIGVIDVGLSALSYVIGVMLEPIVNVWRETILLEVYLQCGQKTHGT